MRERTPLLFLALTAALSAQAPLPTHARLEGEVVTPMLVPCANAEVELELDGIVVAHTRSDAQGAFAFPKAPPGFVVVRASTDVPDIGSAVVDLLGETIGFVTVRVAPARTVRGVVRDETGKPVPGAWVGASPKGCGLHARSSCSTLADGNGAYLLTHVAYGTARVRAWAPDAGAFDGLVNGTADCTLDCVVDRSEIAEVEFLLDGLPPNAQSLDLRVRAGQDYESVPLPPAIARPAQVEPGRWLVRGWRADDELCAHFANAEIAVYPHEALVKAGVGSTTRHFDAADPDARIRGIVRDADGKPVPGLTLAVQPLADDTHNGTRFVATTHADGTFLVQSPVATGEGFALRALSDTLAIAGNDGNPAWFAETHRTNQTWELTTRTASTVRARVVDRQGAPAPGIDVLLVTIDGHERVVACGVSDRRGRICLDGLSLDEPRTFRLECRGRQGRTNADVPLARGGPCDLGELRLEAAGSLRIHVQQAGGEPAPGIAFTCFELNAATSPRYLVSQVDRNGDALWAGLAPGLYYAESFEQCNSHPGRIESDEETGLVITLHH